MKYVKTLGLAVTAAAALMALVGAGTASATVICKNNLNTETCSEPYAIGTEGTASVPAGGSISLTTTTGETLDQCTGSTVTGKLQSQGKELPALSEQTSFTFSSCTFPTNTLKPGLGELTWIKGTDNGTLVTKGVEVTINTALFGSCVYGTGTGTDMGTTVGGNPGRLEANAAIKKVGGGFACPETTKFTGTYVATNPTNAWVSNG